MPPFLRKNMLLKDSIEEIKLGKKITHPNWLSSNKLIKIFKVEDGCVPKVCELREVLFPINPSIFLEDNWYVDDEKVPVSFLESISSMINGSFARLHEWKEDQHILIKNDAIMYRYYDYECDQEIPLNMIVSEEWEVF